VSSTEPSLFDPVPQRPLPADKTMRFDGQIKRVFDLMVDERWRTLDEMSRATGDPHSSISAQLRHLRKPRFGAHTVNKRPRGDRLHGLWEYQLVKAAS